ncbi:MAG TPA: type II toxin-antitoxin system VapC family toxin [Candidatus Eisenbacteria bacterium]|jgi:PIN domain nuclease of toxin-antitoxin system|nr:type II toxin-antitoxin system VapC family toxin [Candidatus Eisenbacteria bacterium]
MRLLLDTHIWIWSDLEPWRLTSDVTRILSDTENELWLSPISVWELIVHLEKKRITLEKDVLTWIAASKQELSLREAPMSWAVAEELRFVVLRHRDPADRFLVATARVQDLTLVTADRTLMEIDGVRILPNC